MTTAKLKIGQAYKVTQRFADAVGASYLVGKMVIYEGVIKASKPNLREGDSEIEQHRFKVTDSGETITCDKETSMHILTRLF